MATEFELKYLATQEAVKRILADFPGGSLITMTTTYYDTVDAALSKRKWALRHRQEGTAQVCTLKTPGTDELTRGEWECICDNISEAIPILAEASGLEELIPITRIGITATCGAQFQRIGIPVRIGDSTAELAVDQGVLVNREKTMPLCECEVELKSGDPEDILRFSKDFAVKYGLTPESRSKFVRAKALGQEE